VYGVGTRSRKCDIKRQEVGEVVEGKKRGRALYLALPATAPRLHGHELRVRAALHHAAFAQHHNAVGACDGGQTVGYDERRARGSCSETIKRRLHHALAFVIESRGGFVQEQQLVVRRYETENMRYDDKNRKKERRKKDR
jgi:hypothetical protein